MCVLQKTQTIYVISSLNKKGNNMVKKILTSLLATLMFLIILPTKVFAEENEFNKTFETSEKYVFKQLDNIKNIDLNNTLSPEEYYSFIGQHNENFKTHYAPHLISVQQGTNNTGYTRYLLVSGRSYTIETWNGVSTWRDSYGCEPRFAVQLYYASSGAKPKITAIKHADMYTGLGSPCTFEGNIYVELISGKSFYYSYSGNLYQRGQMNVSGSLNIGIGKAASVKITISNGDGFISNIYNSETFKNDLFTE